MKFIIDDANIAKVKEIWDLYPCDGVTTNPSILAKSGRNPYEVLSELREIVGKDGELHVQGVNITATAIYTPMQAFLAAKAGAKYTAPYINRIDNFGYNGVQVAMDIQDIFENNNLPCEVLAASFKNSQQVLELTKYGIGAATIGCEVIENLIKNKAIDAAIDVFNSDFASITGEGKTMADC